MTLRTWRPCLLAGLLVGCEVSDPGRSPADPAASTKRASAAGVDSAALRPERGQLVEVAWGGDPLPDHDVTSLVCAALPPYAARACVDDSDCHPMCHCAVDDGGPWFSVSDDSVARAHFADAGCCPAPTGTDAPCAPPAGPPFWYDACRGGLCYIELRYSEME